MDRTLERRIYEVEERHWWYRGRRLVIAAALDRLDLPPRPQILDAGCGSGRNMVGLAELGTVTGIEISEAGVERARARAVGEVVQASITQMPFADGRFDLAVCLDVIEHLDDDAGALRELRRVVSASGTLLVAVPAYQSLWSNHDVVNHHRRRYNRGTLSAVARSAGWTPFWSTYFNACLLPVAAGHRRLERLRPKVDEPVSDLDRTPGYLNALLELPLRFEAAFIRHGGRIPAGLSLIVAFKRTTEARSISEDPARDAA